VPLSVCPAATARAPVGRVWELLSDPRVYDRWVGATIVEIVPPGPAQAGQRIGMRSWGAGRWWPVRCTVEGVDAERHVVELRTELPLGLRMRNRIACTPIDARSCHVQFG
jgi:hypothetical protein